MPTALVESQPANIDHASAPLNAALTDAPSGTVLYQAGAADPAEATKKLLANHPDATIDPAGKLTRPPVPDAAAEATTSLPEFGKVIGQATGVSKVTLEKSGDGFTITGHINPSAKLASGKAGKVRDPRLGALKTPNLDLLAGIEGDAVYARYLDDYDVYDKQSKAKNKQSKLVYLEGRAARKLGRSAERKSIAAYGAKSGYSRGKNNQAIEL